MTENSSENPKVRIEVFYNGYFFSFKDLYVIPEIIVVGDGCPTTYLCSAICANDDEIDLTPFFMKFAERLKEHPNAEVKAILTGFGRKMSFNPDLLSLPSINIFEEPKNSHNI